MHVLQTLAWSLNPLSVLQTLPHSQITEDSEITGAALSVAVVFAVIALQTLVWSLNPPDDAQTLPHSQGKVFWSATTCSFFWQTLVCFLRPDSLLQTLSQLLQK